MTTVSELAVSLIIRALAAAGIYFGGRAAWRRRKQKRSVGRH
jgi:hypothetical protein